MGVYVIDLDADQGFAHCIMWYNELMTLEWKASALVSASLRYYLDLSACGSLLASRVVNHSMTSRSVPYIAFLSFPFLKESYVPGGQLTSLTDRSNVLQPRAFRCREAAFSAPCTRGVPRTSFPALNPLDPHREHEAFGGFKCL